MLYTEKERQLKVNDKYDIIVVGSGPSGIGAALSAGMMGARVLLIEAQGSVGGISTSGLMSHFTGHVHSNLYQEILRRAALHNKFKRGLKTVTIDPELLRITYYELLKLANVDLLLYTFVCDTIVENSKVKGIICESKSGREAFFAKVVIDCTGDGDVAYRAGAEYFMGREEDGKMQPATLMFKVGGVDYERAIFPPSFETTIDVPQGEIQDLGKKNLPFPAGHVLLYGSTLPGVVTVNMTNVTGIDGTKAEDLTRAELICRSQMEPIVEFLRKYAPGYENCYILSAASLIGIRETRHFKGVKTLHSKSIAEAEQFDDWVVRDAHFNFDIHNLDGFGLDPRGCQHHFHQMDGYTIPYGCLVPEKIDGLLLSGRNISGTHKAHSSFRAMPICLGIGQAGGVAAALAVRKGIELREVDPKEIQKYL